MNYELYARIAYEAYRAYGGADLMPNFDGLRPEVQAAWAEAAKAVAEAIL